MGIPLGESLTVLRQSRDRFGDPTDGGSHTIDGCAVWPAASFAEVIANEDLITWDMTALLPPGSDVLPTDVVVRQGVRYSIDGQPITWNSYLTGYSPGIEVHLKTATG